MAYGGRTPEGFTGEWKFWIEDKAKRASNDDFEVPNYNPDFVFDFLEFLEGDPGYQESLTRTIALERPTGLFLSQKIIQAGGETTSRATLVAELQKDPGSQDRETATKRYEDLYGNATSFCAEALYKDNMGFSATDRSGYYTGDGEKLTPTTVIAMVHGVEMVRAIRLYGGELVLVNDTDPNVTSQAIIPQSTLDSLNARPLDDSAWGPWGEDLAKVSSMYVKDDSVAAGYRVKRASGVEAVMTPKELTAAKMISTWYRAERVPPTCKGSPGEIAFRAGEFIENRTANCINSTDPLLEACVGGKSLHLQQQGAYYAGAFNGAYLRSTPGAPLPTAYKNNANAVRIAYMEFREDFVAAMQHCHNGLISNEKNWNEAFAKLENVPDDMKKYHPNFLKQFDATNADKSATIRSRIWRVPGTGATESGEAADNWLAGGDCAYCKCPGNNKKGGTLDCGGVPIIDAVEYSLQLMGWGQGANTSLQAVVYHPVVTMGVTAQAALTTRLESAAIAVKVGHGAYAASHTTSLHRTIAPGKKTLLQFAIEKYTEWLRYRCFYIEREDNQFDETKYADLLKDPDAEFARVAAERQKNVDRAKVRGDIALGIVQKAAFREQCFMLSKVFSLVNYKKVKLDSVWGKKLPYVLADTYHKAGTAEEPCVQLDPKTDFTNASLQVDGSAFGFMNLLTADPKMMPLYQAHHSQLSMLQPLMRFFKVTEDTVNGEERTSEQEIDFDAYETNYPAIFDPQQMMKSANQRGHGVGVKSFDFTYDGSNPFAVKKSIKAKLVIFANSFDELMRIRGTQKKPYRYVDLALKTGGPRIGDVVPAGYRRGNSQENASEDPLDCIPISNGLGGDQEAANLTSDLDPLDKLNFRLKAVVGYSPPPPLTDQTFWHIDNRGNRIGDYLSHGDTASSQYNSIEAAVNSSFVSLNLTPTTHDFKFDEMGRVTFTINYLAYIEDFFDDRHFNIFTDLDIAKWMLFRRLRMDKLKKACKSEEINKIKEEEKDEVEDLKLESMKILTQRLFNSGRVHYLNISYAQLREWKSKGPYADMGDLSAVSGQSGLNITEAKDATARIVQDAESKSKEAGDDDEGTAQSKRLFTKYVNDYKDQNIPYFYVADLVDTILEGIDAYMSEEGMQAIIQDISEKDGLPGTGKEFITECDKAYEVYKLKKFAEQFRRYRTVLGPVEIVNPIDVSKSLFVNLGDIPVSIKYFNEWLTAKLLKKDRAVYTLPRFLNDFFNHLLRNFLNNDTCFNYNIKQKIKLNQAALTDYCSLQDIALADRMREAGTGAPGVPVDTLTSKTMAANYHRQRAGLGGLYVPLRLVPAPEGAATIVQAGGFGSEGQMRPPILNISGPNSDNSRNIATAQGANGGIENETNYMVFYAGRSKPTELMRGHLPTDMRNGIMHYNQGQDVGIVKTIDLKKTSSPGLAEVRFEQDGYEGLEQLRVLYDATISTFCLPNVMPGQYLYVDPRGFSPSEGATYGEKFDLTRFGIGGYFMAHKVEHSLGLGVAQTTIHAKWVAEVTKETAAPGAEVADPIPGNEDADPRDAALVSKCSQHRLERKAAAAGGATMMHRTNTDNGAAADTVATPPTE